MKKKGYIEVQEYRNGKPWGKPFIEKCKHKEIRCTGTSNKGAEFICSCGEKL